MTKKDRWFIYYFFAIYIWYDAYLLMGLISLYFYFSGWQIGLGDTFSLLGHVIVRAVVPSLAIFMYSKGNRFDIYMWAMSAIIIIHFLKPFSSYLIDGISIFNGVQPIELEIMIVSIIFLSSCANIIYLILRRKILKQPPFFRSVS